jgi:hypothetical protein
VVLLSALIEDAAHIKEVIPMQLTITVARTGKTPQLATHHLRWTDGGGWRAALPQVTEESALGLESAMPWLDLELCAEVEEDRRLRVE